MLPCCFLLPRFQDVATAITTLKSRASVLQSQYAVLSGTANANSGRRGIGGMLSLLRGGSGGNAAAETAAAAAAGDESAKVRLLKHLHNSWDTMGTLRAEGANFASSTLGLHER